jgi:hypothetical protein
MHGMATKSLSPFEGGSSREADRGEGVTLGALAAGATFVALLSCLP